MYRERKLRQGPVVRLRIRYLVQRNPDIPDRVTMVALNGLTQLVGSLTVRSSIYSFSFLK